MAIKNSHDRNDMIRSRFRKIDLEAILNVGWKGIRLETKKLRKKMEKETWDILVKDCPFLINVFLIG